jgi:hypothetical protein
MFENNIRGLMELLPQQDVELLLQPYLEKIHFCMCKGVNEIKNLYTEYFARREERTKTNFVRDGIVLSIKEHFRDDPNISFFENEGLFLLRIKNKLNIRFNKLDNNMTITSNSTNRIQHFKNQEELFPEFNLAGTNLIAGYVHDFSWEKFSYYISCPNGKTISWIIDIGQFVSQQKVFQKLSVVSSITSNIEKNNIKIKSDLIKKVENG